MIDQVRILLPEPKCNLKCSYCINKYFDTNNISFNTSYSDEYDCKEMFKKLDKYIFNNISFWGGEPLFNEYFPSILKQVAERYEDVSINVLSNGIFLTKEIVQLLNKYNVHLSISHDAYNQHFRCHDFLTDEYIDLLNEVKHFNGFNVVVHNKNLDLVKIVEWFDSKDIKGDWQVSFELFELTDDRLLSFVPSAKDYVNFYNGYKNMLKLAFSGHNRLASEAKRAININRSTPKGFRCGASSRLCIDTSGHSWHCQVTYECKNDITYDNSIPSMCSECKWVSKCKGICPLIPDRYRKKVCMMYHLYYDVINEVIPKVDEDIDHD